MIALTTKEIPRMRILTWVAAAVALLVGAPVALAHQGSPNFLSQVNRITPATDGVRVTVVNRDDQLLLQNTSGKTVVVVGYVDEPYARIDPDGTVFVNTDSQAYYINQERDGKVGTPAGVDSKGAPQWKEVSRTGRFEWHDHRMHWMAKSLPPQVKDKNKRTKIFDYKIPLQVNGKPVALKGTLVWVGPQGGGFPVGAGIAFALIAIALLALVIVVRRRRTAAGVGQSTPSPEHATEAW
jgi:hypothetical protein